MARFRVIDSLERLVQLYEATDPKGEVTDWRKTLSCVRRVNRLWADVRDPVQAVRLRLVENNQQGSLTI